MKAAEARGLLEFLSELMNESVPKLEGTRDHDKGLMLQASVASGIDFDKMLRGGSLELIGGVLVPRPLQQRMLDSYTHHVTLYIRGGGELKPKHHLLFHLVLRCHYLGHPSLHATFRDESLNGVIARIARSAHRNTFSLTTHRKCNILQALGASVQMH